MKPASEVLKIVTPEEVEVVKKPSVRKAERTSGDDVDPRNLMDLLGDIDGLKHEIHERMRRIAAVKQAKSVLQEDAERTEALNRKLAGLGKAMSAAQAGFIGADGEDAVLGASRTQAGETIAEMEPRPVPVKVVTENVAPWPKTEEPAEIKERVVEKPAARSAEPPAISSDELRVMEEASAAFESAFQRLEEAEQSRTEAWRQADRASIEAKQLLEDATSRLDRAVSREEEASAAFKAAQQAQEVLFSNYQSAQERLNESELRWRQTEQTTAETRTLIDESKAELAQIRSREGVDAEAFDGMRRELMVSYEAASRHLEETEQSRMEAWKQAEEASAKAGRLLEEATLRLDRAVSREEQASAAFLTAHEALSTNYQSAQKRLDDAEQTWRQTEQATAEAKQLLDQALAEVSKARSTEGSNTEGLDALRHEFTAAYQSAQQRLDESEEHWRQIEHATAQTRQLLEQSTTELLHALSNDGSAAESVEVVRSEFVAAYESAQERIEASEQRLQQMEQATAEVRRLVEQSSAELAQVRTQDGADTKSLELMRQEFSAAYESAQQRLEESEQRWQQTEKATAETRRLLEQSTAELLQVRSNDGTDSAALELMRQEFSAAYESAQQRLEESEQRWQQTEKATAETRRLLEQSTAELLQARSVEGADTPALELMRQEFSAAYQSAQLRLQESEERWQQTEKATAEMRRLLEQSTVELAQARSKGTADSESLELVWQEFATAYQSALERLDESETRWHQTEQSTAETRHLLEQSRAELMAARGKDGAGSENLELLRLEFASAIESSQQRLDESERRWKQMEEASAETKRLLEQSKAEFAQVRSAGEVDSESLDQVRSEFAVVIQSSEQRLNESERRLKQMEESAAETKRLLEQSKAEFAQSRGEASPDLESMRLEFATAQQAMSKRLEDAEKFWQRGEQPLADSTQRVIDQTTAELLEARSAQETAAADLQSARQELTTAYQFAAVAAQRRLDAEASFQKLGRWAVMGTVLSWIAMSWMAWFSFREQVPIWGPGGATLALIALAFFLLKKGTKEG